jgi:hypothetical protein
MFAAVIRATLLMIRDAVAKIRVGFIDCSDRAVLRMCAGRADNDGYSFGSDVQTRSVELKCDGCTDHYESDSSAGKTNGAEHMGRDSCYSVNTADARELRRNWQGTDRVKRVRQEHEGQENESQQHTVFSCSFSCPRFSCRT